MEQEPVAQTTLDQMVSGDRAQLLKAAVPYLPPRGQQIISLYSKIQELQNTMTLFSPARQNMQICAVPASDPMEMLRDLQKYSYGQSRQNLDQITNMLAVVEMMKLMNE